MIYPNTTLQQYSIDRMGTSSDCIGIADSSFFTNIAQLGGISDRVRQRWIFPTKPVVLDFIKVDLCYRELSIARLPN